MLLIEEVGPTIVFDAAFEGDWSVGSAFDQRHLSLLIPEKWDAPDWIFILDIHCKHAKISVIRHGFPEFAEIVFASFALCSSMNAGIGFLTRLTAS